MKKALCSPCPKAYLPGTPRTLVVYRFFSAAHWSHVPLVHTMSLCSGQIQSHPGKPGVGSSVRLDSFPSSSSAKSTVPSVPPELWSPGVPGSNLGLRCRVGGAAQGQNSQGCLQTPRSGLVLPLHLSWVLGLLSNIRISGPIKDQPGALLSGGL